ncbi:MAG: lytic transglycosylase [Acidobacteria bacterium]|nr:MAG: lytic transglycosylase [Acidobacteriota bacterium]
MVNRRTSPRFLALPVALLVTTACQTAQRPAALLPASQAIAPNRSQSPAPAPAAQQSQPPQRTFETAQPKTPEQRPSSKPSSADDLLNEVDKAYQLGQENYQAGHLDVARQNFERALDLLGNTEYVLSDERLQPEFDKVLAALNSPGLQPTHEEDAGAQKAEPAPIDEVNEVTPPVDANVKAKAEADVRATRSDLPLMLTDPVAGYINYFSTRGKGTLERALTRAGRYRNMIQNVLKEQGVPQDLIYLAQAESGFYPQALSRAGARGMWQFMSSRGRGYGLQRNYWIDERLDPEKATRAAARHLRDLYTQFGDWYLAMAAYNSGPGTVQQAVRRTGYADYWELYNRSVLPKETRNYVPIILAMTIMTKNPARYGLDEIVPERPLLYDTLKLDYSVDLRLVAQCVDVPVSTLLELNPTLLRYVTPKDQEFGLHLPPGTKTAYLSAIEPIPPEMRVWWRYHKVAPGDTLSSIARAYRTSPKAIAQENNLQTETDFDADSKLVIPITPGKHAAIEDGATYARRATRYKVRKGDTVESVADNFAVPPSMVRRWNHLKADSLRGRRIVYIHLPVAPSGIEQPAESSSKSRHKNKLVSQKAR